MTGPTDTLKPGDVIADYRIDKVLGAGSFGVTYLAHDMQLSRGVAIKEYMPAAYARRDASGTVGSWNAETAPTFQWGLDRFSDEARTLAHFNHPNIVKVMRLVNDLNGTAYIVMELLDGINLETLVERDGPLTPDVFLSVFRQLLDGVAAIHKVGILHRDIKPPNIVIKDETPVLIDFGAARDLAMQRKAGFSALVTDGYSPLEQYSREQEQRPASDIYALAATAYFLMSGRIPPTSAARVAGDSVTSFADLNAGKLSTDILEAIDWGLALKMDDRPQSVAEWRAKMPSIERAKDVPIMVVQGGGERKVNRRALLLAGGGVVVAGAAAALFLGRDTAIDGGARPLKTAWEHVVAKLYSEPFGALAATADGVLVAAHQVDAGGSDHLLALRLDDRGDNYGSYVLDRGGSRAHAILPAPDGGAYVGGDADGQALIIGLDRDWAVRWTKTYDAGSVTSLMTREGGLIAGLEGPESSGKARLLLLGSDGNQQNDVTLLDRQGDSVQRIVQLDGGDIAVLGLRLEDRIVANAKQQVAGLWVARVAPTGEERWRLAESGLGIAQGWDLVEAGGDIFVAGRTSRNSDANKLLLMRVDRDGKKLWSRWDYSGEPASGRGLATVGRGSPKVYLAGWAGDPRRPRLSQLAGDGTLAWDAIEPATPGAGRSSAGIAMRPDGTGFAIGLASNSKDDLSLTVRRLI